MTCREGRRRAAGQQRPPVSVQSHVNSVVFVHGPAGNQLLPKDRGLGKRWAQPRGPHCCLPAMVSQVPKSWHIFLGSCHWHTPSGHACVLGSLRVSWVLTAYFSVTLLSAAAPCPSQAYGAQWSDSLYLSGQEKWVHYQTQLPVAPLDLSGARPSGRFTFREHHHPLLAHCLPRPLGSSSSLLSEERSRCLPQGRWLPGVRHGGAMCACCLWAALAKP